MAIADDSYKCPVCSFNHTHIKEVKVNRGGEITTIDKNGTHLTIGRPAGRGSSISIIFWCEEGHSWEHVISFNKGQTYIVDLVLAIGCEKCRRDLETELWRT